MQIIMLMALTIYLPIWALFHPTYLMKDQRIFIGGDQTCTVQYENKTGTTTTITAPDGILSFANLTYIGEQCHSTGLLPIQPQWKWRWEDDNAWKNGEIDQPI